MENIDQNGSFSSGEGPGTSTDAGMQDKKATKPRAWLAGLLAVIMPGLGHLYLGLPALAVIFFLAAVALANLTWAVIIFVNWGWPGIALAGILMLSFFVWQIVDVVRRGRRIERRRLVVPWYMLVVVVALWVWGSTSLVPVFGDYKTFKTTASAMEQTLMVGDQFTVDLNAYRSAPIKRGDIIVFLFPVNHETKYVKRCIGLPGDTITIVDKKVYINGQAYEEPSTVCYIDSAIRPRQANGLSSRDNFGPYVVAAGNYFVLGDNRDNSSDSRFWGCVPRDLIMGKVRTITWSGDLGRLGKRVE